MHSVTWSRSRRRKTRGSLKSGGDEREGSVDDDGMTADVGEWAKTTSRECTSDAFENRHVIHQGKKKRKINKIQTHSGGTTDYGHHTHKLEIQYYANFVIAARSRENPSSLFTLHPSPSPRYALHRDRRH